ncbi:dual specificity protein phosphatase 14 isoform X2 [Myotis daubentonii]|uniref:dual specificity protein phosphatase 14 isoform X2 n=1 Tax=Myotis daubentonii TaxID=98922 RepID=UPI0028734339|nr:dual specificity protein phosphatase 14 isoform X2 [Myotis daubentonii]
MQGTVRMRNARGSRRPPPRPRPQPGVPASGEGGGAQGACAWPGRALAEGRRRGARGGQPAEAESRAGGRSVRREPVGTEMQLSEQLGRAELNTMDSDVDSLALSLAILNPETSVLQWEWHVHSEHLAIFDPSNNLPALELSNTSCAYLGLLAEVPLLSGGLCVLNGVPVCGNIFLLWAIRKWNSSAAIGCLFFF